MSRVVVVGGGISGLATAYYLTRESPELELLLVESQPLLGGTLGSERVDGFVFEKGANGFLDNVSDTLDLCRELDLGDRLLAGSPATSRRYLFKKGGLHPLPMGPGALLKTPLLSVRGRLRLLTEPFHGRPPADVEDDSVASFGRRRLGEEAMRTFLDPLVTGIYGGDVERLSMRSAFPQVAQLETEHGSLVKGMIRKRRESKNKDKEKGDASGSTGENGGESPPKPEEGKKRRRGRQLYSFPDGMQELVDAIAAELGDRVRLSWKSSSVRRRKNKWIVQDREGNEEAADAMVLALPAYRTASLLASSAPETAQAFEAIPYAPIAVACFGYESGQVGRELDGFGFLIPRDQGRRLLGSIWASSIFPPHAPEGHANLRCLIGGARDPDIINSSDANLLEIILDELRPILKLEGEPKQTRIFRWSRGIPQYNLGHRARVERIERHLWNLPGLFVTGNAYHGIGLNDCVREARRKARAVKEFFRK